MARWHRGRSSTGSRRFPCGSPDTPWVAALPGGSGLSSGCNHFRGNQSRYSAYSDSRCCGRPCSRWRCPGARRSAARWHRGRSSTGSRRFPCGSPDTPLAIALPRGSGCSSGCNHFRGNRSRYSACCCNPRCGKAHNHSLSPHALRSRGNNYRGYRKSPASSPGSSCGNSHNPSAAPVPRGSGLWFGYNPGCGSRHRCSACCCNLHYDRAYNHLQ